MARDIDMVFVLHSPQGLRYLAGLVTKEEAMAVEARVTGKPLEEIREKYAALDR
jgi:hypothetical protein